MTGEQVDASPPDAPVDCLSICLDKASSCGAPSAAAQKDCQGLCEESPTSTQLECIQASECSSLSSAFEESGTTPVDILDKPRPEYTAEGRSLKLEGDVVIDLVFLADGTVQVNRVLSGIGHGLDECATHAAKQIKFKPAKRDGQAVDFPARVRIEFRLAY